MVLGICLSLVFIENKSVIIYQMAKRKPSIKTTNKQSLSILNSTKKFRITFFVFYIFVLIFAIATISLNGVIIGHFSDSMIAIPIVSVAFVTIYLVSFLLLIMRAYKIYKPKKESKLTLNEDARTMVILFASFTFFSLMVFLAQVIGTWYIINDSSASQHWKLDDNTLLIVSSIVSGLVFVCSVVETIVSTFISNKVGKWIKTNVPVDKIPMNDQEPIDEKVVDMFNDIKED